MKKVCITGGAGYVGSILVPKLLSLGYDVTVLDLFWFGLNVFDGVPSEERDRLHIIKGDIRNRADLLEAFQGQDAVIHLACISNDPSYELAPKLGKSINYDCFPQMLEVLKICGIQRFLYASSSSVYGIKDITHVTEEAECQPLTDYSKFKLACEALLREANVGPMEWSILRPATVCGWAPRLRLDLTVNILTMSALTSKTIIVHGGRQLRPNINIEDMARAYVHFLEAPKIDIHRQTFNVGFENHSVIELAYLVVDQVAGDIKIVIEPTKDHRSYHVNSDKVRNRAGFKAQFTIGDAIESIRRKFYSGQIPDPMNPLYYNIKRMNQLDLGSAG